MHTLCYDILRKFHRNHEIVYLACTSLQNICAYSGETRAILTKSNRSIIPGIIELINDSEVLSGKLVLAFLQLLFVFCNSSDVISLLSKVPKSLESSYLYLLKLFPSYYSVINFNVFSQFFTKLEVAIVLRSVFLSLRCL